ncbi:MAG TPA: signal peptidase I [Acidobacteriota bacterium]|nr:signal peptidase I [Acidobacteriota bacterium]
MADSKKAKTDKPKETQADKPKETQQHSTLREYYVTTAVMTIFALFVTTYVVHPMTVPTPSMEPTILVGDRLLIDKFTVRNGFVPAPPWTPEHEIRRGDIIVFKFPKQPEVLYVKRAIGLPGETIEIRSKNVYINGQPLDEPYKIHSDPHTYPADPSPFQFGGGHRDNFGPVQIPPDHYFMMGDNRDDSADSRYFGFLPRDHIVGRPLIVFWSYEDDRDAYLKTSPPEIIKLYAERVIFFFTRTRWDRMFRVVR